VKWFGIHIEVSCIHTHTVSFYVCCICKRERKYKQRVSNKEIAKRWCCMWQTAIFWHRPPL